MNSDYRPQINPTAVSDVPAGVCRQRGEKIVMPEVLKKMVAGYRGILGRHHKPQRTLPVSIT
jgi:hypothetical protein